MEERTGVSIGKRRHEERFDSHLERLRSDAEVVEAQVHGKGETHQVELADVFILVLIDGFEPAGVAHGKGAIVTFRALKARFTAPLSGD